MRYQFWSWVGRIAGHLQYYANLKALRAITHSREWAEAVKRVESMPGESL